MMKPWRCLVCGETYLGEKLPDRCPFCGASGDKLVPAAQWVGYGLVEMDPETYELCRTALGLEVSNMSFYRCCAAKAQHQFNEAIFKRLMKQELEHAELFARLMGTSLPESTAESCPDEDAEKFAKAHVRERHAIGFYLDAATKSKVSSVKDAFRAVADIETEHLQLSSVYR